MNIQKSLFKDVLNCINDKSCVLSIKNLNEDLKKCGTNKKVTEITTFENSFSIFIGKLEVKFFYNEAVLSNTVIKNFQYDDDWFGENIYINIVDTLQEILE